MSSGTGVNKYLRWWPAVAAAGGVIISYATLAAQVRSLDKLEPRVSAVELKNQQQDIALAVVDERYKNIEKYMEKIDKNVGAILKTRSGE